MFSSALAKLTVKASFWTILSYGWSQSIRFFGNLVLTRLLVPEDFGLMQIVFVFLQGVSMFSDLGISPNLIQHPKGEDPEFIRTTWTVQVLRGILIAGFLVALAKPLALLYKAPLLAFLIPLASLNAIIDGFTSTNLIVCYRKMELKRIAFLDMFSQTMGILAMILVAWHWRSVFALLVSSFVSGTLKMTFSHIYFTPPKMHFSWNLPYLKEIIAFGRWVFVGSIAGFLFSRIDRILLGLYLSMSDLGLYGIAAAITMAFFDVLQVLSDKVLIPLYSHLWKHESKSLSQKIFKVRAFLMAASLLPLFGIIIWGQELIDFLYPPSYKNAGWMIRILAVAGSVKCICTTIGPILYAVGDSFRAMLDILVASCLLVISMIVGWHFFGTRGVIWAIPIAELLNYPVTVLMIRPYGTWLPKLDFIGFSLICLTMYLGGLFWKSPF